MQEVFIVGAVRTAIGSFGGSLKEMAPAALGALVAGEALRRARVDPSRIGQVVFGQVIPTGPRDAYLPRIIGIEAGVPVETPAMSVNRLCGSGLQAVLTVAQGIMLGDFELGLAGGAEVMSQAPFHLPAMRWGRRLGDGTVLDGLTGALTDPFHGIHMGITAENVAQRFSIDRAQQDALALESHWRAARAIEEGRFREQIVPVELKKRGKVTVFDVDEHVRADVTAAELSALKPAFKADGTVTAGNASGINDGAAALVLAGAGAVRSLGLEPLARLVAYGHAGVEPAYMGIGPVPATRLALQRAGLAVADLEVIESNEAFAAQACAVSRELGFDPQKVNPNGSGISLGHPIGATGAINTVKLLHELRRSGGRYGLVTMCIGGGQGIAALFERA